MTVKLFKGKSIRVWVLAFFSLVLLMVFVVVTFGADSNQTTKGDKYWPGAEWRTSTPEEQGMDSRDIQAMIKLIQDQKADINSVLIIRNGYLVTEAYFYPYQKGVKHVICSCTKSVTSALVGIAIHEGYIKSVNDKVLSYFRDLKVKNLDKRKKALTIKNLLTMTTGFHWQDDTVIEIPQMMTSDDPVQFVLDKKMDEEPGSSFNYCTGASQVLSGILQKTTGMTEWEYAKQKLFEPLGIQNVFWSSTRNGINTGGSGLYLTPTDMAKFGYLYIKKGKWNNQQIIPEPWIEESTQKQIDTQSNSLSSLGSYGYQWWMPNGMDGFVARGYGGQLIYVIPSSNLVVVFTSTLPELNITSPDLWVKNYIITSIKSKELLHKNPNSEVDLDKTNREIGQPPQPKSVSQLPEITKNISGKIFRVDDKNWFSFKFGEIPDELKLSFIHPINGAKVEVQVGLDGLYQLNQQYISGGSLFGENQLAAKGRWTDDHSLIITLRPLEEAATIEMTFTFNQELLNFWMITNDTGKTIWKGKAILEK